MNIGNEDDNIIMLTFLGFFYTKNQRVFYNEDVNVTESACNCEMPKVTLEIWKADSY